MNNIKSGGMDDSAPCFLQAVFPQEWPIYLYVSKVSTPHLVAVKWSLMALSLSTRLQAQTPQRYLQPDFRQRTARSRCTKRLPAPKKSPQFALELGLFLD
jgi:hypothetical protein